MLSMQRTDMPPQSCNPLHPVASRLHWPLCFLLTALNHNYSQFFVVNCTKTNNICHMNRLHTKISQKKLTQLMQTGAQCQNPYTKLKIEDKCQCVQSTFANSDSQFFGELQRRRRRPGAVSSGWDILACLVQHTPSTTSSFRVLAIYVASIYTCFVHYLCIMANTPTH